MSNSESVRRAGDHCDEIADRLSGEGLLFVALDFDGTLAPITAGPGETQIDPVCRAAIKRLATSSGVAVGVLSGRELSDLKARVGLDGIVYGGNHGLELERDGAAVTVGAGDRWRPIVEAVAESLADRLEDVPGCFVEQKGPTATVHYRQVPEELVPRVRSTVRDTISDDGSLEIHEGKAVLEIRPATDWDKGSALLYVAKHLAEDRQILYVGDDTTDEDAFEVVDDEGVGIRVGHSQDTAADYCLDSRAQVAPFLEWLGNEVVDGADVTDGLGTRA